MYSKMIGRRMLACVMSFASILSTAAMPLAAYAAETETTEMTAYAAEYPDLEEVREWLDDDEIVTASDIEVDYGSGFDAERDFEGLFYDAEKVKISLYEAKNDSGQSYSSDCAGVYHATYYVEPVSGNPAYRITRAITVNEPVKESEMTESSDSEDAGENESESDEEETDDPEPQTEDVTESYEPDTSLDELVMEEAYPESETEIDETEEEESEDLETESVEDETWESEIDVLSTEVNENQSYVSGLAVKYLTDGTAPFDDNDEAGYDSSSSNHIVRSYDYVNYTLEYTTALADTSHKVDEAYMMIQFELDCDPTVAEFDDEALHWCEDEEITYIYADGTQSTTWDSAKEVTAQILTGMRHLSKNGDSNAIPGTGTLSVEVYVKSARNGDRLQPKFTVWMEGNDESHYQSVTADEVVVSAAPKYNICLTRNTSLDYIGYWDLENGTVYDSDASGLIYGRLEGYGIVLQLYNDSANKGLKGIELPEGDITFDVTVTENLDGSDVSAETDYTPILWDYEASTAKNTNKHGTLGRWMAPGYITNSSYACFAAPANKGGGDNACYNGGSFTMTQDSGQKNVWHVTISGYAFDMENLEFPVRALGDSETSTRYGSNIGCFSAGYVEFICAFPDTVSASSDLEFRVSADNMQARSVSGQNVDTEMVSSDNASQLNVTLYPKGTISKSTWYSSLKHEQTLSSHWSYGDAYSYQGASISINSRASYSGDGYLTGYNLLQKIDDTAIEIPAGTTTYSYYKNNQSPSDTVYDSVTVLFAAKPDGSGWASEDEMQAAREENLIYFDSIDALTAAGYVCVGYLYEVRGQIYAMSNGTDWYMDVTVKDSAEINSVYMTTNDLRAWQTKDVPSWTNVSYGSGAYGLGASDWIAGTYADGYTTPTYTYYLTYGKAVYEEGTIVSGHTGGYHAGNSLLIIGCKTGVSIEVDDMTTHGNETIRKSDYDLDSGERTVDYVIHPSVLVVSENREVESSNDTTTVTVKAELPKDLTYIMGSANITPSDITENEDGTSTITWVFEDRQIGSDMDDITFACTIGAAGTADDVHNNDTITIEATITADKDSRRILASYGNYSEATISVIKLAASSVAKDVKSSLVEAGEDITYVLHYGNSSEVDVDDVSLYDILPYNGDGRDSSFNGSYMVDSISLDFSSAKESFEADKEGFTVRYVSNIAGRDTDSVAGIMKGTDKLSWTKPGGSVTDGTTISYSGLSLKDVAGLYFDIGSIKAQEYLTITVTLKVTDANGSLLKDSSGNVQQPADYYANSFYQYADGQVAVVESNTVTAQVVERLISGLAWLDADGNGIRDEGENLLSGISAALYSTAPSGYDAGAKSVMTINGVKLYTAYTTLGTEVEAVTTGSDGFYQFTGLEAGTYYVVFTGTEGYGLTVQNAGEDDTLDSDAAATLSSDASTLVNAYISDITLPALNEMYAYSFESTSNDAGFISLSSRLQVCKAANGTDITLENAVFVMQDSDGNYLTFEDGVYTGSRSKVNDDCYMTTGEDGRVTVSGLPVGTYTLSEYQAPAGYLVTGETWTVAVKSKVVDGSWICYVTVDGVELEDELVITDISQTTTVTVTKAWSDNNNQDGLRGDVVLSLAGTVIGEDGESLTVITRTGTIRAGSTSRQIVFSDLPVYVDGREVTYSVTEEGMDGYSTAYAPMDGSWEEGYSIVITNTHTPETTEYTVLKAWDDDGNRDGVRPESIEVKLLGSDGSERVARIAADDGWKYTFKDLPVYWNQGQKISYSLEESPVSSYVRSVSDADEENQFAVTNTHEIRTVDIPVVKIWDDNDDQDGVRTDSITVILTGSDGTVREAELTAADEWQYTFTDLPYYWNEGAVITYSLQEKAVDGYSDEVVSDDGYSFTVTNNHIPAVTDLVVSKAWDDADNQDGIRPESIHVTLSGSDGNSYEADLSAENGYSHLFSGLPVYYDHGTPVVYSAVEEAVDDYEAEISVNDTGYIFTITNTHEPEVKSVPVSKVWDDNDDQDGIRPESITVVLAGSNGKEYEAELTAEGNWSYVFENVDVYWHEGEIVEYILTEAAVEGYEAELTITDEGNGFILTNTHEPEITEVAAGKIWDDAENQDGIRPDSIHVTLTGSDGGSYEADLSAENGYSYQFSGLPVYYDHGTLVVYTVGENVPDGYESEISVDETGYHFTITNTHEPEVTEVPVSKVWDDNDDQDGIRPDNITVTLNGSNGKSYEAELTAENGWTYVFEDVDVYWNEGEKVVYSPAELTVEGYDTEAAGDETGFFLTNTHEPETTEVIVRKIWDDDGNRDGVRPDSLVVTLTGSDGKTYQTVLGEETEWGVIFTNLPVYFNHGERIVYTVTEDPVEKYTSAVKTDNDGYQITITNSYDIAVTEISVLKAWSDADNQDGVRPLSVRVILTGSDGRRYTAELSEENGWAYTFGDLPVYWNGGQTIEYSLHEAPIEEYSDEVIVSEDGYSFTVSNNHVPALADIVVKKIWDDNDDQDGVRPESITVILTGSDGSTCEAELNAENGFVHVFTDMPVYFNEGELIDYTLTEVEVEGYETSMEISDEGYTFIITNTHTPEEAEVMPLAVTDGTPKTGDDSRPLLWAVAALVAAAIIICCVILPKYYFKRQ